MDDRRLSAVLLLAVVGLCGYLAKCLRDQQRETVKSISTATSQITTEASRQIRDMTTTFGATTTQVTSLAEVLMLGRDSPSSSESNSLSSSESEPPREPEIDLNALPESARWAAEEELGAQVNEMPWQSSTPPGELD